MSNEKSNIDWFILLPVVSLMLFSIAFVYSASANFAEYKLGNADNLFINHAIRILIGIVIIIFFAKIDYHFWRPFSRTFLMIAIILLVFVLFVGSTAKGASRWIDLGPFSFQPSELAKFALVLHFAHLLSAKQDVIKQFESGFLPFLLWTALVCGLIVLQPNFSTMMVIFMISVCMMFIGNVNLIHLGFLGIMGIFFGIILALAAPYRVKRLMSFMGMGEGDAIENVSYQLNQALLAIGNGGWFGVGPGESRQSALFLPESYGDFIFSIIAEEIGFFGLMILIFCYILIFWRGMIVAKKAPDNFGYFLAVGILSTFAIYAFVNAGVNTGLLPTTGVPLPFISYGGTAVFIYAAAVGILLNISSHAGVYKVKKEKDNEESD